MIVFHHDDLDGYSAAAIFMHKKLSECGYDKAKGATLVPINYPKVFPFEKITKGEPVYFLDIGFTADTAYILKRILDNISYDITWIDHHKSSIELEENPKYSWLKDIPGCRCDGFCGAMLTEWYLEPNKYSNNPYEIQPKDFPMWLQLVDLYDCWKRPNDAVVMNFASGLNSMEAMIHPEDVLEYGTVWHVLINGQRASSPNKVREIVEHGEGIREYDRLRFARSMDQSFIKYIDGIKTLCVNERGNSTIFGNQLEDYDMVCTVEYNGKEKAFDYSLYSKASSKVECGRIAEKFGGGGHQHAAGFKHKGFFDFAT